jgi:hypothetical protein
MSNEQWTPEQEQDYLRAKGDFDALNAQRTRVQQANRARLEDVSETILTGLPATNIEPGDLADELANRAFAVRVALAPYDKGPPAPAMAVEG